jgi:dihydrofolate reductase
MKLYAIAAMDEAMGIGLENDLPWQMPSDFQYFKDTTMGSPIIMGRKTLESLPGLLPGRQHIVLTRNPTYFYSGVNVCHDILDVGACLKPGQEAWVIGGAEIYDLFEPYVSKLYLTTIHSRFLVDTRFPKSYDMDQWKLVSETFISSDSKNPYAQTRAIYHRL